MRNRIRSEESELEVGAPLRVTAEEMAELLERAMRELNNVIDGLLAERGRRQGDDREAVHQLAGTRHTYP